MNGSQTKQLFKYRDSFLDTKILMDIGNLLKQGILMYEEQGNEYAAKRKQIE